jgi:hypothetical protein
MKKLYWRREIKRNAGWIRKRIPRGALEYLGSKSELTVAKRLQSLHGESASLTEDHDFYIPPSDTASPGIRHIEFLATI